MFDHRDDRYGAAGLDVGCDLSELGEVCCDTFTTKRSSIPPQVRAMANGSLSLLTADALGAHRKLVGALAP
jgi:hypothetical protein